MGSYLTNLLCVVLGVALTRAMAWYQTRPRGHTPVDPVEQLIQEAEAERARIYHDTFLEYRVAGYNTDDCHYEAGKAADAWSKARHREAQSLLREAMTRRNTAQQA